MPQQTPIFVHSLWIAWMDGQTQAALEAMKESICWQIGEQRINPVANSPSIFNILRFILLEYI